MPQQRLPSKLYMPKLMGRGQFDDHGQDGLIKSGSWLEPFKICSKRNSVRIGRPRGVAA